MFKPMLAPHEEPLKYKNFFKELKYPLFASPKFDGIRCIVKNGIAMSRTWKPLPSQQAQLLVRGFEHFDGELIEGNPTDYGVYNRTQSHIMSEKKIGDLHFHVFDYTHPDFLEKPFSDRLSYLYRARFGLNIHLVNQRLVENENELLIYEDQCLIEGYEGLIMKVPSGHYKCGRGTWKQALIYKLKRFSDDEGIIVDLIERNINTNAQTRDELGYAKRSSAQAGMIKAGILGKFIVLFKGIEIEVAPGVFTHKQCKDMWDNPEKVMGQTLKFRYFGHGIKDKPRHPRAIGFRSLIDM